MNYSASQLRRADFYRSALLAGLGAQLLSGHSLFAQDGATNAPATMEKTQVVGSYIRTAETVTLEPIQTVSAADIQITGTQDVLAVLKSLSIRRSVEMEISARPSTTAGLARPMWRFAISRPWFS